MLVPPLEQYVLVGQVELTRGVPERSPGATTSGLILPSSVGPQLL